MTTDAILADIGAIDASLLSLPIDELDRASFYVNERERLLRKLELALAGDKSDPAQAQSGLRVVSQKTTEIRNKLELSREKILESMRSADQQLRLIAGFRQGSAPLDAGSPALGRILSRIG